jgi:hypothetical protein
MAALLLAAAACAPLPDTGRDVARLGPTPPLVPLDTLLAAPEAEATAESAAALAARGEALKAEAAAGAGAEGMADLAARGAALKAEAEAME